MNIDLKAVFSGQVAYADVIRGIQYSDLSPTTNELFDTIASILDAATDDAVLFVPHDPAASEQNEQGWTISHVVAHLTATLEEAAASAAMVARGVVFEGRLRYETPWEELSTLQLVQARLHESRRMCMAFLNAWPDEPHLSTMVTRIPALGPINAIGSYMLGIAHGQAHLDQLRDTLNQYASSVTA